MNKYQRNVTNLDAIDVYDILNLYGVKSHAVGHAIKKLLMAGQRGAKDYRQDLREAVQAIKREIDMQTYSREEKRDTGLSGASDRHSYNGFIFQLDKPITMKRREELYAMINYCLDNNKTMVLEDGVKLVYAPNNHASEQFKEKHNKSGKPSWSDAPEWAQWLAQDREGLWCWYERKPVQENTTWRIDRLSDKFRLVSGNLTDNANWKSTLEPRPQNEWIEWKGGERPVGKDADVEVKLSDGSIEHGFAYEFDWGEKKKGFLNIVSYRMLK